jgi:hypothetical protein
MRKSWKEEKASANRQKEKVQILKYNIIIEKEEREEEYK